MDAVKVRIGIGLGVTVSLPATDLGDLAAAVEQAGFDSLWFSEKVSGSAPDPVVAMAVTAARTRRLKFGMSVMILPGRNPVLLAKTLASLDQVSGGRLLPAFGLGAADPAEQSAFAQRRETRGSFFDEALEVVRRCWREDVVDHRGRHFVFEGVRVEPKPVQRPPEVWLGGRADSELRRAGRLADGWLPSFITPTEAAAGWARILDVADEHGRRIDPEHFGVLVPFSLGEPPARLVAALAARRPGIDPRDLVPAGSAGLRRTIEAFTRVGASKFVVLPLEDPDSLGQWADALAETAEAVLDLQT